MTEKVHLSTNFGLDIRKYSVNLRKSIQQPSLPINIILKTTMLLQMTLFVVLSKVHQSLQQGISTQMSSASYKKIEVEYDSWMEACLNEAKIFLTDSRPGYAAPSFYFLFNNKNKVQFNIQAWPSCLCQQYQVAIYF